MKEGLGPFTVVISVHGRDRADWLRLALESVIDQSAPPTEVIVTQDGPIGQELSVVLQDVESSLDRGCFRICRSEKPVGRGDMLGLAMEGATTELVAIMDSDDVADRHRFEKQLAVFRAEAQLDVVGGLIREYNVIPGEYYRLRRVPERHDDIVRFAKWRNPINHMTVMFRRKAVLKAGNYQTMGHMEDMWLWCRVIHTGGKFYNMQEPLVDMRAGPSMHARRVGLEYARQEIGLLKKMKEIGYLSWREYLLNLGIRVPARLLPPQIYGRVMNGALREEPERAGKDGGYRKRVKHRERMTDAENERE